MVAYTDILMITSWCATCRAETAFEHPECGDEHGRDCPEWSCVQCGTAVMIGFELADPLAHRAGRAARPALRTG